MLTPKEQTYLQRCVELATKSVNAGDRPFGSVLVLDDEILREERNQVGGGDHTQHPEFALARWAANELSPEQRQRAVVYTSGEHCPMCAAAHGWVGLGRIVYISSAKQLATWLQEFGADPAPINMLPITDIVPNIDVLGPIPDWDEKIKALHQRCHA